MTNELKVPPKLGASLKLGTSLWKRATTVLKMLAVFILILVLLIPLGMIRSTMWERLQRRNQAVAEITSTWGKEQMILGPVLSVPYRYSFKTWREQITLDGKVQKVELIETATAYAHFLPATLTIDGRVTPEERKRGIYKAVVYSGELKLTGQFTTPDFAALKIEAKDVLWADAVVTFAIPDLRGTRQSLELKWGDERFPLVPGSKLSGFESGVHTKIASLQESEKEIPFVLNLTLNGSSAISFVPIGVQTTVKLTSPWPDPSFRGAFLPSHRNITATGFDADWEISYYGRSYSQQWTDREPRSALSAEAANASQFGVAFIHVVDAYRNVERAIKYGILFVALTFVTFFLFEVLSSLRIHPFQYTLVGGALCLFYLALLSLSEVMLFPIAYLVAAAACTAMISLYCLAVLKSGRRTSIVAGLLAAIYGFLYISLQLQDYSLLFGTIGLFVVMALVMYATRNIDWYARDQAGAADRE